jgi:hypothetical protein
MRSALLHTARTRTWGRLAAAAAACALLGGATLSAATAATAGGASSRSSAALQMALRHDLRHYLATRRTAEHISAVSLRVTFRGTGPAPCTCPPSDTARMPAGYLYIAGVPPSLLGQARPPLALTWAQGAGGIVTSLADMTTWDRALYQGQLLPPRQQHQLESLVPETTGKPIRHTTLADPAGYGFGVQQVTSRQTGAL